MAKSLSEGRGSALLEQDLDTLCLAVAGGIVEGGVLVVVDGVDVRAVLQEQVHAGHLAVAAGKVQPGAALFVRVVLVCAVLQQLLQQLNVACPPPKPFQPPSTTGNEI